MSPTRDLHGQRFGRLVVLERAEGTRHGHVMWLCRCDCGTEKIVAGSCLKSGDTTSCGCRLREVRDNMAQVGQSNATHGQARQGRITSEWRAWMSMQTRCFDSNCKNYPNYGGRGITVCEPWRRFEVFFTDMGPKPTPEHSIDRKDNNGNYEPGNCQWAIKIQQARNRRTSKIITMNGRSQSVAAWAEEYGVKADTVRHRLARGITIEQALTNE